MRKYLTFLAVGSLFATVEEFLTVVILRRDIASYVFTLLVLFPVFLTFAHLSSRLLERLFRSRPVQDLAYFFIYGFVGLMIEWFLVGLSPWSDPDANPALMLLFQIGMFSFWATVAFLPRLFLRQDDPARQTRRSLLKFCVPYFAIVYTVSLVAPERLRFALIVSLVVLGYTTLNLFYLRYFLQVLSRYQAAGADVLPPRPNVS